MSTTQAQGPSPQRVLITAAASGIGLQTALDFVQDGARVFICDADALALQRTLAAHGSLAGMVCDVSQEAQVAALFRQGLQHLGGLDVLVNCAGIAGPTATVAEMAFADWRQCLSVNLDGTFLCCRAAAQVMGPQGSGAIVNLSSTAGLYGFPRRAPYASAKWALRGLTKTLAQELGPRGVRVNCVCPGSVEGERMDRVIAAEAAKTGQTEEAVRTLFTQTASLRTFVSAQDISNTIRFLASAQGARISGQEIVVDGNTETL
ncbi:3-oxoacyl-[acyl-carrier-protein] reductase [Rhodoferax lacus]|uniref:3-oxoacyl-[acyl-carrier-protein] reductase n=1 Tax=Rhodoferax lacus TaxID=2184758 RepID=A0A3E1RBA5_9BURK|nr:SDR family oxidoreductase [Rhodoferax lacus]RFO96501.1 3-oxoacyl-[acyl-carrier-protein] reductase [Rhodoferax lacus]